MSNSKFNYAARGIALIGIIVAVSWGLYVSGGPIHNRELKIDQHRITYVRAASQAIYAYYRRKDMLPGSLSVVLEEARGDMNRQYDTSSKERRASAALQALLDASTHEFFAVAYVPKDANSFELCTTFLQPSDERDSHQADWERRSWEKWRHPAGPHCFEFKVTVSVSPYPDWAPL